MSPDGLTIINQTLEGHIFYDGQILRHAYQESNGAWYVTTHGIGNNENSALAAANSAQGPQIFRLMDQHLRYNIDQHNGTRKAANLLASDDLDGVLSPGWPGGFVGVYTSDP